MKKTTLLLLLSALIGLSPSLQAAGCDRECLRGHITGYLYALLQHDPSALPVAKSFRYTENSKEQELGKGLWRSVSKMRGYRQDFIDERTGVVGSHVVLEESGAPTLLVLRLKIENDLITEIETVTTRSRTEGAIFNIDGLDMPSAGMQYVPKPSQLNSREDLIRIGGLYPKGLEEGSFVTVDVPYTPEAYRLENGAIMAGPDCTRAPDCINIKTQKISPGRKGLTRRLVVADERMGIAWYRLSWPRGDNQRLVVWEAFKVYDGKMHAVEAFMKMDPADLGDGWGRERADNE